MTIKSSTKLRALRLRHGITLEELAQAAGVSNQYISRVELRQVAPTWTMETKCKQAIESLIASRYGAATSLETDYRTIQGCLLEWEEPHGV